MASQLNKILKQTRQGDTVGATTLLFSTDISLYLFFYEVRTLQDRLVAKKALGSGIEFINANKLLIANELENKSAGVYNAYLKMTNAEETKTILHWEITVLDEEVST